MKDSTTTQRPPFKTEPQQQTDSVHQTEEDYCGNISIEDMQNFEEDMEQ